MRRANNNNLHYTYPTYFSTHYKIILFFQTSASFPCIPTYHSLHINFKKQHNCHCYLTNHAYFHNREQCKELLLISTVCQSIFNLISTNIDWVTIFLHSLFTLIHTTQQVTQLALGLTSAVMSASAHLNSILHSPNCDVHQQTS